MMIEHRTTQLEKRYYSLNPYSNGMMIELDFIDQIVETSGLNPYSNGMIIEQATHFVDKVVYSS